MKIYRFIIILFVALSFSSYSQKKYDLKDCLEIGLKNNYDILIVKNQQKISDNNASIGNAGYLPTIDLSSSYLGTLANILEQYPADGSAAIKNKNVLNQTFDAGIYLNWSIFEGLNTYTNYKKLKEFQEIGKLNTQLAIENFIAELCTEYYNYVQQTIRLKNLQSAVTLSKERLRIVEAQYGIGSMSRLDFQQAKVDFNADSSSFVKQQEALFSSRVKLNKLLVADSLEQFVFVEDTNIDILTTLNKEEIIEKILTHNTLLTLSEKEMNVNVLELKNLQSKNYPYLRINAGYGYTYNRYQASAYQKQHNLGLNYGVTLGINIFDGTNRMRQQNNAKIEIENNKLIYNRLELELKSDFSNIWMAYQNNISLIQLEEDNLITAKETYEIALERYKLGNLSGIALREAQNSLLEAEERYLQAIYNTKLCEISIFHISGQITHYLN